ncbi:PAS domain-containing protein [Algoriphagus yeomjeoni]|uniref:histidine kinase n=1 Tax=Algoriphagus yeomjeoni TaxID=291403 RepID=A0A327PQY3_9BACT|nr:PAS domain-containing protein [Algoriphagus yeomjeoni]RAI94765.1 two-component system CheB/CheR fusion protein [Algoriphagus yeomjeoni]
MPSSKKENSNSVSPTAFSHMNLSESGKELFEVIENISGVGFWKANLQTGENQWSDQFYKICGLDRTRNPPSTDLGLSIIHPEDKILAEKAFENSIEQGKPYQLEKRIIWPSGEIRYVVSEGVVQYDIEGKPHFLLGTSKDITNLKGRESQHAAISSELGNILDYSIDLIFLFDADGLIAKVSESVMETLGYSKTELVGKKFVDFLYPPDLEKTNRAFESVLKGEKVRNFEIRLIDSNGGLLYFNWSGNLKEDSNQVFGIARDITELVELKKKGAQEKFRIHTILNSSPDLIWSLDRDFKLVSGNDTFLKHLKNTKGWEIKPGDSIFSQELFLNEEIKYWKKNYQKALQGNVIHSEEKVSLGSNESPIFFETKITPIEVDGEIVGLACFSRDVTEKRSASEKIKEQNKQLLKGQEISNIGYWESDLKTKQVFWSDEMYKIWEINKNAQIINHEFFFQSIHPEDQNTFLYHMNRALSKEKKLDFVYRIILEGNRFKYIHEKGEAIQDENGEIVLFRGTAQEITKEKEIELELKDRNFFIESTLNNVPLGIAVNKISDGEATYMNKAFSDIYGWPKSELLNVDDFFTNVYPNPEYRNWIKTKILEDITSEDPDRMSWEGIFINTKDGRERIINAKNIPVPDLNLMISTVSDDTERYLAEQALKVSNDRFTLVSEAISDAIWDWDLENDTVFLGQGFNRLFGYPENQNQASGDLWSNAIHPDDFERIETSIQNARQDLSQKYWSGEYRFRKYNGSYAFVNEMSIIIRNKKGKAVRIVGAIQDISDRKEYENSLQTLNENLKKANHELALSNQELEQFAYVASHDLQEPLRMITSFMGLIEKRYDAVLDEKGKQYIHFAIDGAKRMREIILDLLEFSKLDSVKETKSWVESKELLETSLLFLKKNIDKARPVFHIDPLPRVYGHKNTLVQLFQNLISNAIKYQPQGQKAEIWVSCIEKASEWEFSIRDNGIGIEKQYLEKIFVIFQRLHIKGTYSGTGIGLAIGKKIVELHQGRIWVESTLGQGTNFRFTLKKPPAV